jgi:hypothetical protein
VFLIFKAAGKNIKILSTQFEFTVILYICWEILWMIGIFERKTKSKKIYSEENAYFLNIDITDFHDYHSGEIISLSYQKAYQIGKELYENIFDKLVGAELAEIKSNLSHVYNDKTLEQKNDEELEPADIGNVITYLGKNAWITQQCWKYFRNSYREKFGVSEELVPEVKLKSFFREYSYDNHMQSTDLPKLALLNTIKKNIRSYIDELIKNVYDHKSKSWLDFDVTHEFTQVRMLMIDISNPIPGYVWNLIDGNPFYTIYRVCRDYMKWKKSLLIYKIVFKNVCHWESGSLFSEDEILSKYEEGLWVNWNSIGKDFLSSKNKIMTLNGGLRWLKEEFSEYINQRKTFYDKFTADNNLIFSREIIQSLNDI